MKRKNFRYIWILDDSGNFAFDITGFYDIKLKKIKTKGHEIETFIDR